MRPRRTQGYMIPLVARPWANPIPMPCDGDWVVGPAWADHFGAPALACPRTATHIVVGDDGETVTRWVCPEHRWVEVPR